MATYFPVIMGRHALNWLEALPAGSINSWQDLCSAFVQYYQASYPGPKTRWDLANVIQQPDESLHDYIKMYFANRNTIMEVDDRNVIHHFHQSLRHSGKIQELRPCCPGSKEPPGDQQQIPAKESTFESQLVPVMATKTIVLMDDEPHKTAVIGASLDPA